MKSCFFALALISMPSLVYADQAYKFYVCRSEAQMPSDRVHFDYTKDDNGPSVPIVHSEEIDLIGTYVWSSQLHTLMRYVSGPSGYGHLFEVSQKDEIIIEKTPKNRNQSRIVCQNFRYGDYFFVASLGTSFRFSSTNSCKKTLAVTQKADGKVFEISVDSDGLITNVRPSKSKSARCNRTIVENS